MVEASMKNFWRVSLFIFSAISIYALWHHHYVSRLFLNNKLPEQLSGPVEVVTEVSPHPHDYQRMLVIIDQAQKIKLNYDNQFDESKKASIDQRYLDLKFVKAVLSDLYREHMRITRHIREIKERSGEGIPYKRLNSLHFYQKTVEQYTKTLEEILRHW
jgi:hypothetical protein